MITKKVQHINKMSIAEAVAEEIRKNIIRHNYLPGQRLKEYQLSIDLNVSHTPIREAFRILQAENLVKMIPYVGVEVVNFMDKDIHDLYSVRSIIESSTAELAAKNGTDNERNMLMEIIAELEYIDYSNFEMSDEAEARFHLYIAKISGNSELENLVKIMYRRTQMLRTIVLSTSEGFNTALRQHKLIAAAIINQDSKSARKHMEDHFTTFIEYASQKMKNSSFSERIENNR